MAAERVTAEDDDAEASPPDRARDPRIPAFARDWPLDGRLGELVSTFEAGDYGRVREGALALAKATDDDDVRRAARDLVRRTEPDPLAIRMLLAAALVLTVLAGWYWSHPHHA